MMPEGMMTVKNRKNNLTNFESGRAFSPFRFFPCTGTGNMTADRGMDGYPFHPEIRCHIRL